jgi:drug/metabolite transporter (DMT)-like permease
LDAIEIGASMQSEQPAAKPAQKGFIIALTSAFILAFTGILIRLISEDYHLPALVIAFWRDLFVVLCALPALAIFKPRLLRIKWADLPFLILFGVVLAVFNVFWTLAVTLTGAAVATVLVYSSPAFTAILGWLVLKERLGTKKLLAVVLCLIGCTLVSGVIHPEAWRTNPLGILTGLFSGLLYALYSLMGRRGSQKGLNPWTILFYSFLFAAVILLAINLMPLSFIPGTAEDPENFFLLGKAWRGWLLLWVLAAGPTLLGFGLYNVSLSLLPSSTANLILTLEPVLTTLIAFFLLSERLSMTEIIGSALVIGALILLRFRRPRNRSVIKAV